MTEVSFVSEAEFAAAQSAAPPRRRARPSAPAAPPAPRPEPSRSSRRPSPRPAEPEAPEQAVAALEPPAPEPDADHAAGGDARPADRGACRRAPGRCSGSSRTRRRRPRRRCGRPRSRCRRRRRAPSRRSSGPRSRRPRRPRRRPRPPPSRRRRRRWRSRPRRGRGRARARPRRARTPQAETVMAALQARGRPGGQRGATPATPPTPATEPTVTPADRADGRRSATSLPVGPPMTGSEKDGLRLAVQRCWNVPAGLRDAQELQGDAGGRARRRTAR